MKEKVRRILNNFCSLHYFNTIMTIDEVNYFLENFDTLVFCNGRGRRVMFDKITDKNWKAYTVAI